MFSLTRTLVFTNSELCNLQCKYCFITKNPTDKEYYLEEQKKITEALENKEYINNYLKALNKLNISPTQIEYIELWGQETTLNMESFFKNFDYLYSKFPNLRNILFSTNGVAHTDKIIDAIKIVENTVNKEFKFKIQYSYDSIYTKENRGIEDQIIINNALKLLEELNKIKLKNVIIDLNLHNVMSKEVMLQLDTFEKVENYWEYCQKQIDKLLESNINKNVLITPYICPAIETPIAATQKEGKLFSFFIDNSLNSKYGCQPILAMFRRIMKNHSVAENITDEGFEKFIEKLLKFDFNDKSFLTTYSNLCKQAGCNSHVTNLKMAYDGTLWYCQNSMYLQREEDCNISNDKSMPYFKDLIKHNRYTNILTASTEEIKKHFHAYLEYSNSNFGQIFISIINMMCWCAKAGLIKSIYRHDDKKLLKHAFILCFIRACYHDNIVESGSIYIRSADYIIAYCNGLVDLIEENLIAINKK